MARDRAGARIVPVLVALAAAGCHETRAPEAPRARRLASGEPVPLVITHEPGRPMRYLASGAEVPVRFLLDPDTVGFEDVAGFALWADRGDGWRRVGEAWIEPEGSAGSGEGDGSGDAGPGGAEDEGAPPGPSAPGGDGPDEGTSFVYRAEDGRHALRASLLYEDGEEDWIPIDVDRPWAILYVDSRPPVVRWIAPIEPRPDDGATGPHEVTLQSSRLRLAWTTADRQLARRPYLLEWSPDAGATWHRIGEVEAAPGPASWRWDLPDDLPEELTVRVSAWDAAGHRARSELPLRLAGPIATGGAELPAPGGGDGSGAGGAPETSGDALAEGAEGQDEGAPGAGPPGTAGAAEAPEAGDLVAGPPGPASRAGDGDAGEAEGSGEGGAGADRPDEVPPLAVERAEPACLRPGGEIEVSWAPGPDAPEPGLPVVLEQARAHEGRPDTWRFAADAVVADGAARWTVPKDVGGSLALRLVIDPGGPQERTVAVPGRAVVDGSPPAVRPRDLPPVLGADARLPLEVEDSGPGQCAGLAGVVVSFRPDGKPFWDDLPEERVQLEEGDLRLDLRYLAEGPHEIFLAAEDSLGNRGPAPGPDSTPHGRFILDRTPPRLTAGEAVLDWVGGFRGEVRVDLDTADAVPPIVVDGRAPGGEYEELLRLSSLTLPGGRIAFDVPSGVERYELRVTVHDRAGNVAETVIGPRDVRPAVRLDGFADGMAFLAGTHQRIAWSIHPVARERADELQVAVEHRTGPDASWTPASNGLDPEATWYWEVPEAEGEGHRLRVRLYRRSEPVASAVSPPFRVYAVERDDGAGVEISEASLEAYEKAALEHASYAETAPSAEPGELKTLGQEVEDAYLRAVALDSRNWRATYALARLARQRLEHEDPEVTPDDATRWLEDTLAIVPEHAVVLNDLGADFIRRGEYGRAVKVLRRSVEARETGRALYNLGLALLYSGRPEAARGAFEKALSYRGEEGVEPGRVEYYRIYTWIAEDDLETARERLAAVGDGIPGDLRSELESRLNAE